MPDQSLLQQVIALVRETGAYQLSHFRQQSAGGGDEKAAREFVSQVDLTSEQMLLEGLGKLLPEAGVYGEETGSHGNVNLRWVVDPLDGTTNYLSGLEQFSISVALEEDGRALLGVVLRPASAECFSALRGQGLQHNGCPCPPAPRLALAQALVGTGFPYRSRDLAANFFPCAEQVLYASRGLRRFASAALDLCYVAAGFLQGFWESDLQPYDVAAGLLFLEETGCQVSNQRGEPYSHDRDRLLVCGCPGVYDELLPLIAAHYPTEI